MASRFFSRSMSVSNTLHEAAELGNIDRLQQFVDAGKEMGYPARETLRKRDDLVGATCLHYAAEHGRTQCAKVTTGILTPLSGSLLQNGSSIWYSFVQWLLDNDV